MTDLPCALQQWQQGPARSGADRRPRRGCWPRPSMTCSARSCCSWAPGAPARAAVARVASAARASSWMPTRAPGEGDLVASLAHLPISSASVDAVLLPHTLELRARPLCGAARGRSGPGAEGQLIVLGFRPASLWGLRAAASRAGFPPGLRRRLSSGARARLARAAQLRDRQPCRPIFIVCRARPRASCRSRGAEHAAPRLVLSLACGRLRHQGPQARLHADADPARGCASGARSSAAWWSRVLERHRRDLYRRRLPRQSRARRLGRGADDGRAREGDLRRRESDHQQSHGAAGRDRRAAGAEATGRGAALHRLAVRAPRHPRMAAAVEGAGLEDRRQQAGQEPGSVAAARRTSCTASHRVALGARRTRACPATSARCAGECRDRCDACGRLAR